MSRIGARSETPVEPELKPGPEPSAERSEPEAALPLWLATSLATSSARDLCGRFLWNGRVASWMRYRLHRGAETAHRLHALVSSLSPLQASARSPQPSRAGRPCC